MKRYFSILIMVAMVALSSCNHKDLCMNHRDHAHRYHINIIADYRYDWEELCHENGTDWENEWPEHYMPYDELRPTKPGGLRVVNYNNDGDYNRHNISADGGVVTLYEGENDLLLYNNDTEYIIFSRTGTDASTRATTRTRTRADYEPSEFANDGESTVSPPDMLFAYYIENYIPEKVVDPVDVEVELQPLVYTYKCRFEFGDENIPDGNLKYVALAKTDLSGMAASVLLNTGETSEEAVTILSDDAEITEWGIRSCIKSFGIPAFPHPNYPTRGDANKHALVLNLRLKNGKYVTFEFDVTDQVQKQPHGGVITVSGIVIDEDDVTSGSGAFDVEVDDWGPYEDIDLIL